MLKYLEKFSHNKITTYRHVYILYLFLMEDLVNTGVNVITIKLRRRETTVLLLSIIYNM